MKTCQALKDPLPGDRSLRGDASGAVSGRAKVLSSGFGAEAKLRPISATETAGTEPRAWFAVGLGWASAQRKGSGMYS